MTLFFLASAPVVLLLLFIYLKDKYDKEPFIQVFKILFFGMLTPIPVILIGFILEAFEPAFNFGHYDKIFWDSFIVAALIEETFKFLVIYLFIWNNKAFDEEFDGIVYAMFASMGFALVENFLYVFQSGTSVAILRAFTAVPAHAMFAITMGYFFGLAKFSKEREGGLLMSSLFFPILLHGFYDFILMSENNLLLLIFIPLMIFMIILSFKLMKKHAEISKFNPKNQKMTDNTEL